MKTRADGQTSRTPDLLPDVRRESFAEVDVPEAVGEFEGAAESKVTISALFPNCCC